MVLFKNAPFVRALFLAMAVLGLGCGAALAADPLGGQQLMQDLTAFSGFGQHRAADKGDRATAAWLTGELAAAGLQTQAQGFTLKQYMLETCTLSVDGQAVEAFPFWLPRSTPAGGVSAPLARYGKTTPPEAYKGKIVVYFTRPRNLTPDSFHHELIETVRAAGGLGLILCHFHKSGLVYAANFKVGQDFEPWTIPIVQAGQDASRLLQLAAKKGAPASIVIQGRYEPQARAENIIGRLNRGEKTIVVSTPYSGWFETAAERGSGVALFLGLARWAASLKDGPSWLFVATSAHEINNLGMERFMESGLRPDPATVIAWLGLGASITAYEFEKTAEGFKRLEARNECNFFTVEPFLPILTTAFAPIPELAPRSSGHVAGEMQQILSLGYPAFGFFGGHFFFHTPADLPETTGPRLLEDVGQALKASLTGIMAENSR